MRHTQVTLAALLCLSAPLIAGQVVFTEVMYHPSGNKPEFIEALNLTSNRIDIAQWRIHGGIDYTFPAFNPAATSAHFLKEYERILLSSADEATTRAAYPSIPPFVRIYGPWTGSLNNAGDTITLNDAAAAQQCTLTYGDRGNWPVAADGTGHSLLLINQNRKVDDWRNWKHSTLNGGTPGNPEITEAETAIVGDLELNVTDFITPVNYTSPWKYWRDAADPDGANPEGTWKGTTFDDTLWGGPGNGFFGYENSTPALAANIQTSFQTGYVATTMTYYFRTSFNWTGALAGTNFVMDQFVDDGVIYWLNGTELKGPNLGRVRMAAGLATHATGASGTPGSGDAVDEQAAITGTLDGQLVAGNNVLCAEVHQSGSASSDVYFGARLKIGVPTDPGVVINEVKPGALPGQGFVEFYNPTGAAVDLNGWYITNTAANLTKFKITTPLVVPSLGFATIGFAEAGLTLADPVVIYLTRPDGTTKQTAVSIASAPTDGRSAGRKPAGAAQWFLFATPTPGATNQSSPLGGRSLKLNEAHFNAAGHVDWVEFANPSASALAGAGLFVSSKVDFTDKVALPATIPGTGYASAAVDFPADGGGELVLFLIDSDNNVIDAVELAHRAGLDSIQRYPLTSNDWYSTPAATQNAANNPARHTEIVINEIMYAPPSKETQGEYIELVNRTAAPVSLNGWRLTKGLDYAFPAGTSIAAGEYIVVAKDPAFMTANYGAGFRVFGPADGKLGNNGDLIRLEDANGNIADLVDYKSGGSWPELAGGGGSSMELLHPDMDNNEASSWRASDESNKTTFQTFTLTAPYKEIRTGTASSQANGRPLTETRELLLNLVSDGHIILKSLSLTKSTAPGTNLIPNGDATSHAGSGVSGFLCTGTHRLSDTVGGEFHLISQGTGDTKGNKAEVDVIGLTPTAAGETVTLSFQGRWVSGLNLLVAQTWDRSFGTVFRLPVPSNLGTPGAANSVSRAAAPPTVDGIRHSPPVPTPTQSVIVSARVASAYGLASVVLRERLDKAAGNGTWNSTPMNDSGTSGDAVANDGIWSATIPGRSDASITQFYVRATASNGQVNDCPRDAEGVAAVNGSVLRVVGKPAMYIVDNTPPSPQPGILTERYVFSQFDRNAMVSGTGFSATYDWDFPKSSNFGLNATIILNESDILYGCELRKGGSPWTRSGDSSMERARWKTPGDNVYRNQQRYAIDSDGSITNAPARFNNRIVRYMMYLLGYPVPTSEFVQQIVNGDNPGWREEMELTDSEFFQRAYGDGGELFEVDDAWYLYDTNNMEDRLAADQVTGRWSMTDWAPANASLGAMPSPESPIYFHCNWPLRFPEERYDYGALSSLIKTAFNNGAGISNDAVYRDQMERQIDTERAAIYAAVRGYVGDWDNFTLNRGKNGYIYRRPTDGKFEFHHWDSDLAFQNTGEVFIGSTGGVGWTNYANRPWFRQRYAYYLTQLITKYTRNSARMTAWLDAMNYQASNPHANAPFKTASYNYPASWFTPREQPAINSINSFGGANFTRPFAVTTANNQTVAAPLFTVNGDSPSSVWRVEVVGHPEGVFAFVGTASNLGMWTISNVALAAGANTLTIRSLDRDGVVLSTATLNVTFTGNAPPVVAITADPASRNVAANELLVLDGTGSFDPEGTPLAYSWAVTPATGFTMSHSVPGKAELRFFTPGVYSVTMTVTDAATNSASIIREASVYNTNDFATFGDGIPLGPEFTVLNVERRDNFSASAWYSVEDTTGRILIQLLDDVARPLASPTFTHPLITRDLPDSADFVLQTDLTPDTRQFGNWQSGLWMEMNESGTVVRYAFSLDGGLNVTVQRAVQPGPYVQMATVPVTGTGAVFRITRTGTSLAFQRMANSLWTTVFTQTLPAGATALTGGIFAASSQPTTVRTAFDYLLLGDSSNTNAVLGSLRITEIMYNPSGTGGIEFIELTNSGPSPINLNGVYFEQGKPVDQFTFPSFVMAPGSYVVITNVSPAVFYAAYPSTPPGIVFQWSGGSINNAGEHVTLRDASGNIIQDFEFDDDPLTGWPTAPDGGGVSLEIVSTTGDYNSSANWRAGTQQGGSPGGVSTTSPDTDGDGFPDNQEQVAGTNPNNANDFLSATSQIVAGQQTLTLKVQPGRIYHVETTPSLQNPVWTRLSSYTHPLASPAQLKQFTVNNPAPANALRQFYRIVVQMAP
jgi:hypothetical protein